MTRRAPASVVAAASLFLMLAVAERATTQAPQTSGPAPPSAGDAATPAGRSAYARAGCVQCHGENGQGTVAGGRIAGTARQLSDFVSYVRKPAGSMPPQGVQSVSDRDLATIHAFLRSLPAAGTAAAPQGSAPPAGNVNSGGVLFARVGCFQCHANEGQGGTQGPRIAPGPVPYARFVSYIRQPSGEMPPYSIKVLSDQQLADIYAFLQARPQPPAVNTLPQLVP